MANKCTLYPEKPEELQYWVTLQNEILKEYPNLSKDEQREMLVETYNIIKTNDFIKWFGNWLLGERGEGKEFKIIEIGKKKFKKPSVKDVLYFYKNKDTLQSNPLTSPYMDDIKDIVIASKLIHSNYQFKIAGLSKYISQLYDKLANETESIKRGRLVNEIESLKKRKQALIDSIPSTEDEYNFENVIIEANKDLSEAEELLESGKYAYEYITQLINFWLNVSTLDYTKNKFFNAKQLKNEDIKQTLTNIQIKAYTLKNELVLQNESKLEQFVEKQTGVFESISDLIKAIKDVGLVAAKTLDISRLTDNKIVGAIFNAVKLMRIKARKEAIKIAEQIDALSVASNKKLKELGLDQSIFFSKDSAGNFTGRLLHYVNDSYYKWLSEMVQTRNWTELEDKTTTIDVTYFDDVDENIPQEFIENVNISDQAKLAIYNRLLKVTGNKYILDKELSSAKKKIRNYIDKRSIEWENINSNDKLDDKAKARLFKHWISKNSPYEKLKQKNKDKTSEAYHYIHRIPKREVNKVSTGFYNANYETILNNKELFDYFTFIRKQINQLKYMIPYEERDHTDSFSIPFMEKDFLEKFKDTPSSDVLYDEWIKAFSTPSPSTEVGNKVNIATDAITKKLSSKTVSINQMIEIHLYNLEKEHKLLNPLYNPEEYPNNKLIRENLLNRAKKEVLGKQSFDLSQITKILALNTMMYKYKSKIETDIRIAVDQFQRVRELDTNVIGQVNTSNGIQLDKDTLTRINEALDFFLNKTFYDESYKQEAVSKSKVLSTENKQKKIEYEDMLVQLELNKRKLGKDLYEKNKLEILSLIDNLGSNITGSKIGDFSLKYLRWLTMGWNTAAGVANVMFGKVANYVHSADERAYSQTQLKDAEIIIFKSLKDKDLRTKITKLMKELDVLKKSSEELFKDTTGEFFNRVGMGELSRKLKFLSPYALQNGGEYLNQAPVMIAMMMNKEVKSGISLWEALDESGNIKQEHKDIEQEWIDTNQANEFDRFKIALDQKIKNVHGNYDPDSVIQITNTFIGRSVSQFRKWMFEGFAIRMEIEHFDPALGYRVKGHYRSMKDIFASMPKNDIGGHAKHLINLFSVAYKLKFGSMTMNEAETNTGLSELDIIGLRKSINELEILITTMLLLVLLGKDDDDEDDSFFINFIYNEGLRLKTDILFYSNPTEFMTLVQNPTILFGFYEKIVRFTSDVYNITFGDMEDELQSGPFKETSRTVRNIFDLIPGTAQYNKLVRMSYKQRE